MLCFGGNFLKGLPDVLEITYIKASTLASWHDIWFTALVFRTKDSDQDEQIRNFFARVLFVVFCAKYQCSRPNAEMCFGGEKSRLGQIES